MVNTMYRDMQKVMVMLLFIQALFRIGLYMYACLLTCFVPDIGTVGFRHLSSKSHRTAAAPPCSSGKKSI